MTYADKLLEYISQPENMPVAMEVYLAVQDLMEHSHKQFWPLFTHNIQFRLSSSEFAESWRYVKFPQNRLKKEWQTSYLLPIQPKETEAPVLVVTFGQGSRAGGYHFVYGVAWSRKLPDPNHQSLRGLKNELLKRQLTSSWDWWPGFKSLNYALESGEFMTKFYNTPNEAVEEVAGEYWQLFLDLRPIIEPINQALLS